MPLYMRVFWVDMIRSLLIHGVEYFTLNIVTSCHAGSDTMSKTTQPKS